MKSKYITISIFVIGLSLSSTVITAMEEISEFFQPEEEMSTMREILIRPEEPAQEVPEQEQPSQPAQEAAQQEENLAAAAQQYVSSLLTTLGTKAGEALTAAGTKARGKLTEYLTAEGKDIALVRPGTDSEKLTEAFTSLFVVRLFEQLKALANSEKAAQESIQKQSFFWRMIPSQTTPKSVKKEQLSTALYRIASQLYGTFLQSSQDSDPLLKETFIALGQQLQKLAQDKAQQLNDDNMWVVLYSFITEAIDTITNKADEIAQLVEEYEKDRFRYFKKLYRETFE